jgi:hypothetical protein
LVVQLVIVLLLLLKILEEVEIIHHILLQSQDRLDLVKVVVVVLALAVQVQNLGVMVDQVLL